ncbi:hypothetical protein TNCV_2252211 [Trichonephila clavipes]|nr:hypothetical protein TNCV_2252211 [Trichonephila clavipes]
MAVEVRHDGYQAINFFVVARKGRWIQSVMTPEIPRSDIYPLIHARSRSKGVAVGYTTQCYAQFFTGISATVIVLLKVIVLSNFRSSLHP